MRLHKFMIGLFVLLFGLALVLPASRAQAAFNANRLIDDAVFDYASSMNAGQIDSFLNGFPNSCISPNSGFEARVPSGYSPSGGFTYGGFASAGNVIATSAQVYGLNPQVLLVTLQKEQSLVAGGGSYCNNGDEHKYAAATGYGCPDGGTVYSWSGISLYRRSGVERTSTGSTCVNSASKAGFSQQVIRAAWLLKFGEQRSRGNINWAVISGSWDNSDDPQSCYGGPMTQGTWQVCPSGPTTLYDGYQTIDGSAVHMDTGGTAALYWYTPHFSGNQNFVSIFESWFGSTQTLVPFAWSYEGQWAYSDSGRTQAFTSVPTVTAGGKVYVRVKARNLGNQTWDQSFMHMGASRPIDVPGLFADATWLSNTRPGELSESSVAPGQVGTFDFVLQAPGTAGTYGEYFNLVAEGRTWLNDLGLFFTVNVNTAGSPNNSNDSVLNSGESLNKDDYLLSTDSQSVLTLQRDGNVALHSNFRTVWNTGPLSGGNKLIMQGDGNLVLYNQNMVPLWNSQTGGNAGARLVIQNDGNMVIYSSGNAPLWATYTLHHPDHLSYINTTLPSGRLYPGQSIDTADRRFKVVLQTDGNLVLYSPNRATWATGTDGKSVAFLAMQGDGNLVLYDRNAHPIWYSGTAGHGALRMVIQQDGNLVLYSNANVPYWHTSTSGVL